MAEILAFSEDFSSFPLGPLPYDREHSAMGEYHYLPQPGFIGCWYDPVADYSFRGPTWLVTGPSMDGAKVLEQTRIHPVKDRGTLPTLAAGEKDWQNLRVKVQLRPLSKEGLAGILLRYQTSLMHYGLFFFEGRLELHRVNKTERVVLAAAMTDWSPDQWQQLEVELSGSRISCRLDGKPLIGAQDTLWKTGCIALSAGMPVQYHQVQVFLPEAEAGRLEAQRETKRQELLEERQLHAGMKLHRRISLGNFGAGRQIRFGHLTGTDEWFFVICQHQRRVFKDRYPFISCMTAVSLDTGKVLWQLGQTRDDEDVIALTTDLPFQVYDIDGDGTDEVIASWDFRLMILDGKTGRVKKEIPTPPNEEDPRRLNGIEYGRHAFSRLNVDAIIIANLSGRDRPSDIIIKDRYARLWAYDSDLRPLWKFSLHRTGHFPYVYDFDGDGRDEIFACYTMIDAKGNPLWSLPIDTDHSDEIIYGQFDPDGEPLLAIVSGWEGFMLVSLDGNIVRRDINGHAQRISAGNFHRGREGLEICTTTFWNAQGIIYLYDGQGNELWHREMPCNGNIIAPVNWDGNGQDLILLNASVRHGGLMDGEGRIVVPFPDDGHPDLCAEVLDVTGDNRDELIVWDRQTLCIYTQDRPVKASGAPYTPRKQPVWNMSNYRGEYRFPHLEIMPQDKALVN